MNVLELLLQRIRSPGGSDPAWQAHLADLGGGLPARDEYIRSPGQGGINTLLHPNALGIYGGAERGVVPAGDEVIPSSEDWWRRQGEVAANIVPLVSPQEMRQWLNPNPDALPGPEGFTRIAMRGPPSAVSQMGGSTIPGPRNPLMEQEHASGAFAAPQRENDLDANVRWADELRRRGLYAMPEGAYPPRIGHEQLPPQDPFSSPLNQMLQRPPFGLY